MSVKAIACNQDANFDAYLKRSALSMHHKFLWTPNIPLTIGRVFEELTVLIEVTLRRLDRAVSFNNQEGGLRTISISNEAESSATWDDNIVAFVVGQQPKAGF